MTTARSASLTVFELTAHAVTCDCESSLSCAREPAWPWRVGLPSRFRRFPMSVLLYVRVAARGQRKHTWRSAYESLIKQSHKHHHLMLRYSYLIHAVWWAVRVAHMRRWQERGNADSLSLSLSLAAGRRDVLDGSMHARGHIRTHDRHCTSSRACGRRARVWVTAPLARRRGRSALGSLMMVTARLTTCLAARHLAARDRLEIGSRSARDRLEIVLSSGREGWPAWPIRPIGPQEVAHQTHWP